MPNVRPFSWLMLFSLLAFAGRINAGEAAEAEKAPAEGEADPKDPTKKKEKPKEPPLKYSAWCAFRDISTDLPPVKIDPKSEETRQGSSNWAGFGRRGQWATVVLEIKNTTEDVPYTGTASISLNPLRENEAGQIPYRTNYRLDFDVGAQSQKQYRFSVLCPEDSWAGEAIQVNVTANGRVNVPRMVRLQDLEGKDFIVVVSESSGAFRHLATRRKALTDDDLEVDAEKDGPRPRDVAVIEPSELPTRWHDLALANLVIIDGPPREQLTEAQWSALKSYVQAGGNVLITAGKDPSRLKGPVEDLAGITARDMSSVDSLDSFYDPLITREGFALPMVEVKVNADAKSASVAQYNKKTSLVEQCKRYYGSGSVTFLPFSLSDKVLENWSGKTSIPLQILESARNRRVFGLDRPEAEQNVQQGFWGPVNNGVKLEPTQLAGLRRSLDQSFAQDTPVELQKPPMVMSFILLYLLCAVPGNYFIFGWFKRREVAWLAVPVWAATFSVIAYTIGYMGQTGRLTINEVSIIEAGPGQGIGMARTFVGLYAPRRDEYRLQFPGHKGFDVQAAPGHLLNLEFAQAKNVDLPKMDLYDSDAGLQVEDLLVQQRSTRRLEIVHRVDLKDGLDVLAKENSNSINVFDSLEVTNNTGLDLYYPVFVSQGKSVPLTKADVLRAGEKATLQNVGMPGGTDWLGNDQTLFARNMVFRTLHGEAAAARLNALTTFAAGRVSKFQGGVVCGWIESSADSPTLPIEVASGRGDFDKPGRSEGISLLMAPVPIKRFSDRSVDTARRYKVRSTVNFDVNNTGSAKWKDLSESRTVGLATNPKGNHTNLELEVPSEFRNLIENRMQLVLNCRLAVSDTKLFQGKLIKQTVPAFNGSVRIEIMEKLDNGVTRWQELANVLFGGLENGQPFKIPPVILPLADHHMRDGNVMRVRVAVEYDGEKRTLELQKVDLKAVRQP